MSTTDRAGSDRPTTVTPPTGASACQPDDPQIGPQLDRRVLLGLLVLILGGFAALWIGARDFLPGARLFPVALAGFGAVVAVVAMLRVWRRIEPGNSPGQAQGGNADGFEAYRRACSYLAGAGIYYLAIALCGFMVATALLLVAVARYYRMSRRYTVVSVVAGLLAVWLLGTSLNLYLPDGWIAAGYAGG